MSICFLKNLTSINFEKSIHKLYQVVKSKGWQLSQLFYPTKRF